MIKDKFKVSISSIKTLKENLLCNYNWSPEEDKLLFSFVKLNGINKWEQCALLFKNKNHIMCKERYYTFIRNKITLCNNCKDKIKEKIKRKIMQKYYQYRKNMLLIQNANINTNNACEISNCANSGKENENNPQSDNILL